MTTTRQQTENEARLWERYRRGRGWAEETACPEPGLLAAYLDGRAGAAETREVEKHLISCPSCLETIRELRALRAEPLPDVPPRVFARARTVLPPERPRVLEPLWGNWKKALVWTAAAASIAAASAAGLRLGREAVLGRHRLAESAPFFAAGESGPGLLNRERPGRGGSLI